MSLTKQEVLKIIDEKFTGQAVVYGKCEYLTHEGKRCAIGIFIPDLHPALYSDQSISYLLRTYPELKSFMPSNDVCILQDFQELHDHELDGLSLEQQKEVLKEFAEQYLGVENES